MGPYNAALRHPKLTIILTNNICDLRRIKRSFDSICYSLCRYEAMRLHFHEYTWRKRWFTVSKGDFQTVLFTNVSCNKYNTEGKSWKITLSFDNNLFLQDTHPPVTTLGPRWFTLLASNLDRKWKFSVHIFLSKLLDKKIVHKLS